MATRSGPRRLGLISNPLSGANKRRGLAELHRLLACHPGMPHVEVRTAADVSSALRELARAEVDLVAVNSGDGTVQAVLTSLFVERPFPSLPLLALLAGGTTNMTALDLGLRGSVAGGLRRLIHWARSGEGACRGAEPAGAAGGPFVSSGPALRHVRGGRRHLQRDPVLSHAGAPDGLEGRPCPPFYIGPVSGGAGAPGRRPGRAPS
ncbi:MAG: hypothetical protein EHM15_13075, partial [Desulfobacteraceae bacterium]